MKCERCQKEFRYASELARHLSRKTKCEKVEVEKEYKCKYCIKPYSDMKAKTRHEKICKYKDDYVRNLEIELDIELDIKYSNTTCRFCDKSMRVDTLIRHESTCKAKEIYKEKLIKMVKVKTQNQGGNTIINNNNTTINNYIMMRPLGKENLEYVTVEFVLNIMDKLRMGTRNIGYYTDNDKNAFAAALVKEIHANPEHPENHNFCIPSLKGSSAIIYNENQEFEVVHRKIPENIALKTISTVVDQMDDVEEGDEHYERNKKYDGFYCKYGRGETTKGQDNYERYDEIEDKKKNATNRKNIAIACYGENEIIKKTQKQVREQDE